MQANAVFEMLPLLGFFVSYYFTRNLYTATFICIIMSWLGLTLIKFRHGKITKHSWLSCLMLTIFGSLTIALHNKTFIMLKPSVLYLVFASSLYLSEKMGKNLLQLLLHEQLQLPPSLWQRLNLIWVIFFGLMAILNLVIALNFSEYVWVKFKVFGGFSLMLCNMLVTGIIIYAHTKKGHHE